MLKIYAHQYIRAGRMIHELGGLLYMSEHEPDDPGRPLTNTDHEMLTRELSRLATTCGELGLLVSKRQFESALTDTPRSSRELDLLVSVMEHELEDQLFLYVPSERAAFYEQKISFPALPNATKELIHAGNCFATAEYVASVFHAMRAVEIALVAAYLCMGLESPLNGNRSWGNFCNGIRDAMSAKGKSWPRLNEFYEIYATLVAVKDGWRNSSLHVDATYTEQDAARILSVVTFFIEKISLKMDERGQPLA